MHPRDILGKKHAIDVLLDIYKNPGIIQNEIADKKSPASGARRARLADLLDAGWIRTEVVKGNQLAIAYYVTSEGARVCRLLLEIENGDRHDDPPSIDGMSDLGEKT
jgi:DNA-binding HxlR family transcriptional regulator